MKNFIIGFIVVVVAVLALNSDFLGNKKIKTFSVTADTNVSKHPELAKYVTQEEIDGFAFRYWDIDADRVQNNDKMENLRQLLKSKNTQEILAYMKDNNISVDEPLHYGVTALMYASFYDDINTAKELLNLGADPHKKDKYKLSPMAYAIENNATKSVKLLLENGVKFDEVVAIQSRWELPNFIHYRAYGGIESIVATDGDAKVNYYNNREAPKPPFYPIYFFRFVVSHNLIEIAQMVLESGYKPYSYNSDYTVANSIEEYYKKDNYDLKKIMDWDCSPQPDDPDYDILFNEDECLAKLEFSNSLYETLRYYPNYEPMLELLLKHNVGGQPKPAKLRLVYEDCYYNNVRNSNDTNMLVMEANIYQKYCFEPSETFDDIKAMIGYLNEYTKYSEIMSIVGWASLPTIID